MRKISEKPDEKAKKAKQAGKALPENNLPSSANASNKNEVSKLSLPNLFKVFWRENLLAFIIILISSCLTACNNFLTAKLINELSVKNMAGIYKVAELTILVGLFYLVFIYINLLYRKKLIEKMRLYLCREVVDRLYKLSYEEFQKNSSGTYVSWISNDINRIVSEGAGNIYELADWLISTVVAVISLFMINWIYVPVVVVLAVITVFMPRLFNKKLQETGRIQAEKSEEFINQTTDIFKAHDTIFSYQKFDYGEAKINAKAETLSAANFENAKSILSVAITGATCNVLGQFMSVCVAIVLVLRGNITTGDLVSSSNFFSTILNAVGNYNNFMARVNTVKPLFDKFNALEPREAKTAALLSSDHAFQLENLSFNYAANAEKKILADVNFTFELGKKYAIDGPSGSGKSTLLNIMAGRLESYSGSAKLLGAEIKDLTYEQIYAEIVYVDQNSAVFDTSIRDNLCLGDEFTDEEIWQALREVKLADIVEDLPKQLDNEVGEAGKYMSAGQLQRLTLARGFLRQRKIFLLDESTANLDKETADKIEKFILAKEDITVIMVSHHLNAEIRNLLDDVLEL